MFIRFTLTQPDGPDPNDFMIEANQVIAVTTGASKDKRGRVWKTALLHTRGLGVVSVYDEARSAMARVVEAQGELTAQDDDDAHVPMQ